MILTSQPLSQLPTVFLSHDALKLILVGWSSLQEKYPCTLCKYLGGIRREDSLIFLFIFSSEKSCWWGWACMKYTYISFTLGTFSKMKSRSPFSTSVTWIVSTGVTVTTSVFFSDTHVFTTLCFSLRRLAAR